MKPLCVIPVVKKGNIRKLVSVLSQANHKGLCRGKKISVVRKGNKFIHKHKSYDSSTFTVYYFYDTKCMHHIMFSTLYDLKSSPEAAKEHQSS